MAVIKCKMCGGDLDISEGLSVCECEYCGSRQTVPTADNEKKMTLFSRANRLRLANEFDKAASVYESVVAEFPEEAEAYWGLVLCRYGIEYVDDPATGKKIPTCHRVSFDNVLDDGDFEQACENADALARRQYREEAKRFEDIRRGIIEVSGREEPYDIFICYKETDENGERTIDSVIAQDVYDALTGKGYRVFFSRISLEDKLGTEYEPYIFAALNSAKIMLAFGTDYEFYNAVWVKNEWSRFLKLMEKDKSKHLIPCYKNLDPYDMPKEFQRLQGQDMGKVGAVQDLLRGIEKIMPKNGTEQADASAQPAVQQIIQGGGPNVTALLQRGSMALEDGEWGRAKDFFDQVLNMDAQNAEAYLGLLMVQEKLSTRDNLRLSYIYSDYTKDKNFIRAKKFASEELIQEFDKWDEARNTRTSSNEQEERMSAEERRRVLEDKREILRKEKERKEAIAKKLAPIENQLKSEDFVFSEEETTEYDRRRKVEENAKTILEQIKTAIIDSEIQYKIDNLRLLINQKKQRLDSLGVFKKKEKKLLENDLGNLQQELTAFINQRQDLERKLLKAEKDVTDAMQSTNEYIEKVKSTHRKELEKCYLELKLENVAIGDHLNFGKYKKDGNGLIEWIVLDITEEKVLLIAKEGVDCYKYHKNPTHVSWKNCDLRKWLNNGFLHSSFTKHEIDRLCLTQVSSTETNNDNTVVDFVEDHIYVLNIDEVNSYLVNKKDRKTRGSLQAKMNGCYIISKEGTCCWWLRSPGSNANRAAIVRDDGTISTTGYDVNNDGVAVRPVLWIKRES